jgi:hypothetical protein
MNTHTAIPKIGKIPGFITAKELVEGKQIEAEFKRLLGQLHFLKHGRLTERVKESYEVYFHDPSEKNFDALLRIQQEVEFFKLSTRARSIVREMVVKVFEARVIPFVRPLINRGLDIATQSLVDIAAREKARHLEITGEPLRHSDIVEVARRPVCEFEQMLSFLETDNFLAAQKFFDFVRRYSVK